MSNDPNTQPDAEPVDPNETPEQREERQRRDRERGGQRQS